MSERILHFLEARLAEEEASALAAAEQAPAPWGCEQFRLKVPGSPDRVEDTGMVFDATDGTLWDDEGSHTLQAGWAVAQHMARHDPAHVLRDVAIKRATLADHMPVLRHAPGQAEGILVGCTRCTYSDFDLTRPDLPPELVGNPCPTQRWMASLWSDHADYEQDWAPPAAGEPKTIATLEQLVAKQLATLQSHAKVIAEAKAAAENGAH